eukprot:TRINITY_DN14910_c0_g1_i2.p1 TRINITY_DN14910_c0_g1~~TRINITY_DN14910_c0_g1_i2.p1  ORF type:complete len:433 (+),score=66.93 TRINITY_DN14910_c0_g1_i2:50-1348(+)
MIYHDCISLNMFAVTRYGIDTRIAGSMEEGGVAAARVEQSFRQVMDELLAHVFTTVFPDLPKEAWPDCANLNWYDSGEQGVGWHADDELLFQGGSSDCPIVSLSLGGTREFWIAVKAGGAADVRQGVVEMDLSDGDIITMEGLTQKHCSHFVPLASPWDLSRQEPRINVTFRWLRVHKLQCPKSVQARDEAQKVAAEKACSKASGDSNKPKSADAAEAENGNKGGTTSSGPVSKYFQIVDPETNEIIENPEELAASRSRWLAEAAADGAIVLSPLPKTARCLFGCGPRLRQTALPRPNGLKTFMQGWPNGGGAKASKVSSAIRWQECDSCGHECWGGGRACKEGQGDSAGTWRCRCCWEASEVQPSKGAPPGFQEQSNSGCSGYSDYSGYSYPPQNYAYAQQNYGYSQHGYGYNQSAAGYSQQNYGYSQYGW